jgi:hypothetical protein
MLSCLAALLLAIPVAQAQTPADRSVDDYRNAARRALHACSKAISDPAATPAPSADAAASQCAATAKNAVADKFDAAMTSTMDPAVRAALQRHQAAFFKSLAGLAPLPGEATTGYQQRQAGLRCALTHAWTEIEHSEAEDRFKAAKSKP